MKSVLVLGRQPSIGLAELEALYSYKKVTPLGNKSAALVDIDPCQLNFKRLGGSIKFSKLLSILEYTDWQRIEDFLITNSPQNSLRMKPGKMTLGISAYGFNKSPKEITTFAVKIKTAIRKTGRSVRVVPNNDTALSSAQVIYNKLTSDNGWEINLIKHNNQTYLTQTIKVQNINDYASRDQKRPARDSKIGMLPPKLAQNIINLASGKLNIEHEQSICDYQADEAIPLPYIQDQLLLDPFCGTGVILQEAALIGYSSIGSDIDPRLIDFAKTNISWLKQTNNNINPKVCINFEIGNATKHTWNNKPFLVASETYLGPPLSNKPNLTFLQPIIKNCNKLLHDFLMNINSQIRSGSRLCLAIPAWQTTEGSDFVRLPILDSLDSIGYNRWSFKYSEPFDLIYHRPNQIVGRELLVLTKK